MSEIEWGPVYVAFGSHSGKIGYCDDETTIYSKDKEAKWYQDAEGWRETESESAEYLGEKALDVGIVYFGDFFLASGYYLIPWSFLRPVTTDDLMTRRAALLENLSRFAKQRDPDFELDDEDRLDLLYELNYVESALVDRMIEARYSKKGDGKMIFVSYSSSDRQTATWIATDLANAGYKVWLDEWEIKVGESIPAKIESGVDKADFVVVLLSPDAVSSNWVEREWHTKYWDEVNDGEIQVLPALVRDCEIPSLLKTKKYADFRIDYNNGIDDLLVGLGKGA